jgi:hypothetical protein
MSMLIWSPKFSWKGWCWFQVPKLIWGVNVDTKSQVWLEGLMWISSAKANWSVNIDMTSQVQLEGPMLISNAKVDWNVNVDEKVPHGLKFAKGNYLYWNWFECKLKWIYVKKEINQIKVDIYKTPIICRKGI